MDVVLPVNIVWWSAAMESSANNGSVGLMSRS